MNELLLYYSFVIVNIFENCLVVMLEYVQRICLLYSHMFICTYDLNKHSKHIVFCIQFTFNFSLYINSALE